MSATKRKRPVEEKSVAFNYVDPFDYSRLYGREKYDLQNMLLRQVKIPAVIYPAIDHFFEVWSDRLGSDGWFAATRLIESTANGDAFFAEATAKSFLAFASAIGEQVKFRGPVTGAIIVRHTNQGGYPSLRLTLVNMAKPDPHKRTLYSGNDGPHVMAGPRLRSLTDGRCYYGFEGGEFVEFEDIDR